MSLRNQKSELPLTVSMNSMKPLLLIVILAILSLFCTFNANADLEPGKGNSKGQVPEIHVGLHAPWRDTETSVYAEAAELMADEGRFWAFVRALGVGPNAAREAYVHAIDTASNWLPSNEISVLNTSLSMRIASPKVESSIQLGRSIWEKLEIENENCHENTETWAVMTGMGSSSSSSNIRTFCTIDKLVGSINELEDDSDLDLDGDCGSTSVDADECGVDIDVDESITTDVQAHHVYDFDHVIPFKRKRDCGCKRSVNVFLYGDAGHVAFANWMEKLDAIELKQTRAQLIVRWWRPVPVPDSSSNLKVKDSGRIRIPLSGYGMELNLRKTEYKLWEEKQASLDDEDFDPLIALEQMNLTHGDVNRLGLASVASIVNSDDPFARLKDISQNLPTRAYNLLCNTGNDDKVSMSDIQDELEKVHGNLIMPGDNFILLNGRKVDISDTFDLLSVMQMIKEDTKLLGALHKQANITVDSAHNLLLHSTPDRLAGPSVSFGDEAKPVRIDIRSPHIYWLNDIETDQRLNGWPTALQNILRPVYHQGQIAPVKRNIYNVVLFLDPLNQGTARMLEKLQSYMNAGSPVRFGLVLNNGVGVVNDVSAHLPTLISRVFLKLFETRNLLDALSFVGSIARLVETDPSAYFEAWENPETSKYIVELYEDHVKGGGESYDIVSSSTEYDEYLRGMRQIIDRTNVAIPCTLLNGLYEQGEASLQKVGSLILDEFRTIAGLVRDGKLADAATNLHDSVIELAGSFPRYNPLIMEKESMGYVSLASLTNSGSEGEGELKFIYPQDVVDSVDQSTEKKKRDISIDDSMEQMMKAYSYSHSNEQEQQQTWSKNVIVVTDQSTVGGAALVAAAKEYLRGKTDTRLAVLPHTSLFATDVLKLNLRGHRESGSAVVFNGRVVRLHPQQTEGFTVADFNLLDRFEWKQVGEKINQEMDKFLVVETPSTSKTYVSDVRMVAMSLLAPDVLKVERAFINPIIYQSLTHSIMKHAPSSSSSVLRLTGYLDPLSVSAQRFADLIILLSDHFDAAINVVLNPKKEHHSKFNERCDLPLKSFYRSCLVPEWNAMFNEDGTKSSSPSIVFEGMPADRILTLNPHVPESWLVECSEASVDLDNIRLSKSSAVDVKAEYQLSKLVVTGQCFDPQFDPPRGLQIEMGHIDTTGHFVSDTDTLVMSNLGYFQLKAAPGLWNLRISGRGASIFEIDQLESQVDSGAGGLHVIHRVDDDDALDENHLLIYIDKLTKPRMIVLRVHRLDGMEGISLLNPNDDQNLNQHQNQNQNQNVENDEGESWGRRKRAVVHNADGSGTGDIGDVKVINIFSLVSGHLYERLAKIMMMSVVRNTKTPVRFWFIGQYLSPQFKEILPCMAEKYKFKYSLVSYKWPSWLQKQEEKMRTIWAYKVLFLDVLFPLNVTRIITVDADQVIRTDMAELMAMDLHGAPLGYTPFCDNKKEMDGFRFWKRGFWESHLRGKPYHISALYVVDLLKYREMAAGDMFRIAYEQLSKQEDSLSNLDQDLPNYMQHKVPIYSLPQEWLWCESWCSESTLHKAKTIDLCNNPLTKANKLDVARDMITEWPSLDEEAGQLGLLRRDESEKCVMVSEGEEEKGGREEKDEKETEKEEKGKIEL